MGSDFYHVEQFRHLLGNKLTWPLTVLSHLHAGKRVSRQVIERAIRDLRAIVGRFEAHPKHKPGMRPTPLNSRPAKIAYP